MKGFAIAVLCSIVLGRVGKEGGALRDLFLPGRSLAEASIAPRIRRSSGAVSGQNESDRDGDRMGLWIRSTL